MGCVGAVEKYPHPANAALLAFLEKQAVHSDSRNKSTYDLDEFELHTHPDLCEHLYGLNPWCKGAAYGIPVLATDRGVLFAMARGTSTLALRLAETDRAAAIGHGGRDFAEAGPDWVAFEAWRVDGATLKDLAKAALAGAVAIGR